MTSMEHEGFTIDVSDAELEDLVLRLKRTRWSTDPNNEDHYYGISTAYLRRLVDYWIDGYDWRAAERQINTFDQRRAVVDDTPIHFIHERGRGPAPIPLILSHGWPWTFWDFSKVIRPLADPGSYGGDPADAFDVIVPSLPGYGFSIPTDADMTPWKAAERFHALMTQTLGFAKYAASGSDQGALVTTHLGHKYADSLYGIHLGIEAIPNVFGGENYWMLGAIPEGLSGDERKSVTAFYEANASHIAVHMLDGQTITHGLNDSPVGMLAWILQRWRKWSDKNGVFEDVWSPDDILTAATIYWVTETIGSSIRSYRNMVRYPWRPSHDRTPLIEAPVGFTFLAGDLFPPNATAANRLQIFENGPNRSSFNPVYAKVHDKGGHFGPWENPDAIIEDLRATFRPMR